MRDDFDPYLVLGVSPAATQAEIAHAYRARLRILHPDTRTSQGTDERFQQVLAAYAVLRDIRRAPNDEVSADSTPAGSVDIPVTYRTRPASTGRNTSPLRAGPVRRHW